MKRAGFLLIIFLILAFWSLGAQSAGSGEPFSFVGLTVEQLIERFGAPRSVHAARGTELWQDDVVFQYSAGDFYIHRDRVWQVRVNSAHGTSTGDPRQAAILALGDNLEDNGDHLLLALTANAWPLTLRVNLNNRRVTTIFIYRSDY